MDMMHAKRFYLFAIKNNLNFLNTFLNSLMDKCAHIIICCLLLVVESAKVWPRKKQWKAKFEDEHYFGFTSVFICTHAIKSVTNVTSKFVTHRLTYQIILNVVCM